MLLELHKLQLLTWASCSTEQAETLPCWVGLQPPKLWLQIRASLCSCGGWKQAGSLPSWAQLQPPSQVQDLIVSATCPPPLPRFSLLLAPTPVSEWRWGKPRCCYSPGVNVCMHPQGNTLPPSPPPEFGHTEAKEGKPSGD